MSAFPNDLVGAPLLSSVWLKLRIRIPLPSFLSFFPVHAKDLMKSSWLSVHMEMPKSFSLQSKRLLNNFRIAFSCAIARMMTLIPVMKKIRSTSQYQNKSCAWSGCILRVHYSLLPFVVHLNLIFILVLPRLPKRKKTPSEVLEPIINELERIVSLSSRISDRQTGRDLVVAVSDLVKALTEWISQPPNDTAAAQASTRDILHIVVY